MNGQEEIAIQCPNCWETISILVDCSVEQQEYTEDCQVCCKPMVVDVRVSIDGLPQVTVKNENE